MQCYITLFLTTRYKYWRFIYKGRATAGTRTLRFPQVLEYQLHFKRHIGMAVLVITRFLQFSHQLLVGVNPAAQKLKGGSYAYTGVVKHGKVGFGISADGDFPI